MRDPGSLGSPFVKADDDPAFVRLKRSAERVVIAESIDERDVEPCPASGPSRSATHAEVQNRLQRHKD